MLVCVKTDLVVELHYFTCIRTTVLVELEPEKDYREKHDVQKCTFTML